MSMPRFVTGFRLPWGSDLNQLSDAIDDLQGGGTAGPVAGTTGTFSGAVTGSTFTGALNGTLGATTPGTASVTDLTQNGLVVTRPQILAAAGATQGNAALITKSTVIVTVTASTQGVKLPTAATGKCFWVNVGGTVGVLVYPNTNDKISTASTNVAVLLAADKGNRYIAKDATTWLVTKGA